VENKVISIIPTPEEKFLNNLSNDKYINYIKESLSLDYIFNPFNAVEFSKEKDLYFFEENKYFFLRKTFMEENVGDLNGDSDFFYKLNKDGFRSKNFEEFNKDNINILFAGCSVTFGQGLPEELTWPYMLVEKLEKKIKKNISYYNLALPGASIFINYKNIISFIKNFGAPDYILMSLPETTRGLSWDKESQSFNHMLLDAYFTEAQNEYRNSFVQENSLMANITSLHILEYICDLLGINLLWTSWNSVSSDVYQTFDFKNYFQFSPDHPLSIVPPKIGINEKVFKDRLARFKFIDSDIKMLNSLNKNNLPFWLVARDQLHPGSCFSEFYSNEFLNKIQKYID